MQTTTSNNQVIYIFGNNKIIPPLSRIYSLTTKLSTPIKKISSTNKKITSQLMLPPPLPPPPQSPPLSLQVINNVLEKDHFSNNKELYPLHQLCPNNEELYPLHQLCPNNRSGLGADPFLWLFPDSELLLDMYVPYLLHLYSQRKKIKTDQEGMQFFNNDDSFNIIKK
jgi:hypothetical protein